MDLDDDSINNIVNLAIKNRVAGMLVRILIDAGFIDKPITKRLSYPGMVIKNHSQVKSGQVELILEELSKSGIRFILLKGWAFIFQVYHNDPTERLTEDIDILICSNRVSQAKRVLNKLGYVVADNELRPGFNFRYSYNTNYGKPGWIAIGLHTSLLPFTIDKEAIWNELYDRSIPVVINSTRVRVLSPEDNVAYLSGHLAYHHQYHSALFRYYDIALQIQQINPIDWNRVSLLANKWGMTIALLNTLTKVKQLWSDIVPDSRIREMQTCHPAKREKKLHYWAAELEHSPYTNFMVTFYTQKSTADRFDYLREMMFPSPTYMRRRYGDKKSFLNWVHYVTRFIKGISQIR